MDTKYKELEVSGIKVTYLEYPGPSHSRYVVSMNINGKYIKGQLYCPPTALKGKLEELVFVNKLRRD